MAPQGAEYIEAALGILAAGACFVPISEDHKGAALEEFIRRCHLHHCLSGDSEGFTLRGAADVQPVDGADDEAFRALEEHGRQAMLDDGVPAEAIQMTRFVDYVLCGAIL